MGHQAPVRHRLDQQKRSLVPRPGTFSVPTAHMRLMRTITQQTELRGLALESIIVDDTDTPLQVIDPNLVAVLAGPSAGTFRVIDDPSAVVLPAQLQWEPLS